MTAIRVKEATVIYVHVYTAVHFSCSADHVCFYVLFIEQTYNASTDDDNYFLLLGRIWRHDAQFWLLGQSVRQIWKTNSELLYWSRCVIGGVGTWGRDT